MPVEADISKALTYQVKREIAERYFGVRKLIEEDRNSLDRMVSDLRRRYEQRIGRDLVRIYVLLRDPALIDRFLALIGLEDRPFYDPYVVESATSRARLLKEVKTHGWRLRARFRHLLFDSHDCLVTHVTAYRERYLEAKETAAVINEEIRQFTANFCLDEILSFIGSLDRRDDLVSILGEGLAVRHSAELQAHLDIAPVPPIETVVPNIPAMPPVSALKSELKRLADEAFEVQRDEADRLLRE